MSGFTQVPNWIFDEMATMKGSTLQVVLHIARQTIGYTNGNGGRKEWDRISLSQFEKGTGLTRKSVMAGIENADQKYIERRAVGHSFEFRLVEKLHQGKNSTSGEIPPEVGEKFPQESPKLGEKLHTQKKEIKERKKSSDDPLPTTSDRDGKYLLELLRAAGLDMYKDLQQSTKAMQLESDYTDAELRAALTKTVDAHQKQIKTGRRGITAPLAYMASVLAGMDSDDAAVADKAHDNNRINLNTLLENVYE